MRERGGRGPIRRAAGALAIAWAVLEAGASARAGVVSEAPPADSPPPQPDPVPVPAPAPGAARSASPAAAAAAAAYADAGEPEAPGDFERVTLAEALSRALAHEPGIAVALQEIERAEAQLREARAAELPTLNGTGVYTRLDKDRVTSTGLRIGAANQWQASLGLTVPLIVPSTWSAINRAKDARETAKANAADVRRLLAATVTRAYLAIIFERRRLDDARRARDAARAHFDFAHARLVGGVGNSLDEVRAQQELRTDEAQVAAEEIALARARSALAIAVSSEHALDAADDVPLPVPPDVARATEQARANRADIKAFETRVRGAERARKSVWTLYSPYLTANGVGFVQDLGSALQPTHGWQAQLVLTLPFYDGGARGGVARERAVTETEARLQLEAALRAVAVEVRTAFDVMAHADRGLAGTREAARLAHRAAELAALAYRAGATTNLELIDADRRARDADTAAALAEDTARQARLELLLATGAFP